MTDLFETGNIYLYFQSLSNVYVPLQCEGGKFSFYISISLSGRSALVYNKTKLFRRHQTHVCLLLSPCQLSVQQALKESACRFFSYSSLAPTLQLRYFIITKSYFRLTRKCDLHELKLQIFVNTLVHTGLSILWSLAPSPVNVHNCPRLNHCTSYLYYTKL